MLIRRLFVDLIRTSLQLNKISTPKCLNIIVICRFNDIIDAMFSETPDWDAEKKYTVDRIEVTSEN
jgi:hypothetical protein